MIKLKGGDGWLFSVGELRNTKVRDWYMETYPKDSLGDRIDDSVTMWDVVALLNAGLGGRVYSLLGVGDSVLRERIFARIAGIVGCDYNDVYNTWLKGGC